jgi:hypothetical protein
MVLEIPTLEFDKIDASILSYSSTFESLYIQQYYGYNYFKDAQTNVGVGARSNPQVFETNSCAN